MALRTNQKIAKAFKLLNFIVILCRVILRLYATKLIANPHL